MNHSTKLIFCLAGGLVLNASLRAETSPTNSNPYEPVVARNIFGLNPPPPPPDPNIHPFEPPVKITLNGIMSVFGQVKALFKVAGKTPGKEDSFMFTEGQGENDIEVVKINEKGGEVTFNNHGVLQVIQLAAAAGSGTLTTSGRLGSGISGIPGVATAGNSGFVNTFGGGNSSGGIPSPDTGSNLRAVPTRPSYSAPVLPAVDPAVQTILIEANRLKAQSEGDPIAKILPPTELTPPADSESAPAAP